MLPRWGLTPHWPVFGANAAESSAKRLKLHGKKEFRHAQVTRPSMSADHRKTIPKTQVMRETRGTAPLEHGKLDAAAAAAFCLFAIALLVIVTCMYEELLSML